MAEMITDTRLDIRMCPDNIDNLSDLELDQWLKQNRGTRMQPPIRSRSTTTSKAKEPKVKKEKVGVVEFDFDE